MNIKVLNVRRRAFCCCQGGGVISLIASVAAAVVVIGVSVVDSDALGSADSNVAAPTANSLDAVLGSWDGTLNGALLPPEGLDFVMTLEDDGEGGISGSLEGAYGFVFDITGGEFDEEWSTFTCTLVKVGNPEESAEMIALVGDDEMSGTMTDDEEFEADFEATRE